MYLRALSETNNNDDVLEILGRSTVDSTVLIVKAAWVFSKELTAASLEKEPEEKKRKYQKALKDAKGLRSAASKIPPDGVADHVWRMFVKPWWSAIYSYGSAAAKGDVINISKNDTIAKFDMVIHYIENQLEKIE